MTGKAKKVFEERLNLLNTNTMNRCNKTGFIKINPSVKQRIVNVGECYQHNDWLSVIKYNNSTYKF